MLEKAVKKIGNMNIIHDLPKWEFIQALLSRGDRRVGRLLKAAHEQGGDWKAAARELGHGHGPFTSRGGGASKRSFPGISLTSACEKNILRTSTDAASKGSSRRPARSARARPAGCAHRGN